MDSSIDSSRWFPKGHVEDIEANPFENKGGEQVPQGKLQSRVVFQGFEDRRLAPAAKQVFSEGSYFKSSHEWASGVLGYVKLHLIDDRSGSGDLIEVMVHVDDLAQRFDLSKEEVLESARNGELESYLKSKLTNRMNSRQGMRNILKKLDKESIHLAAEYTKSMKSQGLEPNLTTKEFSYLVTEGYTTILQNAQGFQSDVAFQTGCAAVQLGDRTFLVGQSQRGNISIIEFDSENPEYLSRGEFGLVSAQPNLVHEGRGVLKSPAEGNSWGDQEVSKAEYLKLATGLLQSESRILDKLWLGVEGSVEGIQHQPYLSLSVDLPDQGVVETFIYTKRYEGADLDSWMGSPQANALPKRGLMKMALQGLGGMAHVQDRNIVNGDIKGKNICVDLDSQSGEPSLRMIDWGGAVDLNEKAPPHPYWSDPMMTVATHYARSDSNRLSDLASEYWTMSWFSKERGDELRQSFNKVQHARDTLSLSIELVGMMTGKSPLQLSFSFGPSTILVEETKHEALRNLSECGYPKSVQNVFARLLEEDPDKRLTPSEAIELLETEMTSDAEWLDSTRTSKP